MPRGDRDSVGALVQSPGGSCARAACEPTTVLQRPRVLPAMRSIDTAADGDCSGMQGSRSVWREGNCGGAAGKMAAQCAAAWNQRRSQPSERGTVRSALWKTELCSRWVAGTCTYTDCRFAHGAHELRARERPKLYKTQLCKKFLSTGGDCPYGQRCNFIHAFSMPKHPPSAGAVRETASTPPASDWCTLYELRVVWCMPCESRAFKPAPPSLPHHGVDVL